MIAPRTFSVIWLKRSKIKLTCCPCTDAAQWCDAVCSDNLVIEKSLKTLIKNLICMNPVSTMGLAIIKIHGIKVWTLLLLYLKQNMPAI